MLEMRLNFIQSSVGKTITLDNISVLTGLSIHGYKRILGLGSFLDKEDTQEHFFTSKIKIHKKRRIYPVIELSTDNNIFSCSLVIDFQNMYVYILWFEHHTSVNRNDKAERYLTNILTECKDCGFSTVYVHTDGIIFEHSPIKFSKLSPEVGFEIIPIADPLNKTEKPSHSIKLDALLIAAEANQLPNNNSIHFLSVYKHPNVKKFWTERSFSHFGGFDMNNNSHSMHNFIVYLRSL